MMEIFQSLLARRIGFGIISLLIVILGAGTLFQGHLQYSNWWGGIVFAPFAIIVGLSCLFIAAFRPKFFAPPKKKSRIRGWPTGRSRR
jgi:hypothetical protein